MARSFLYPNKTNEHINDFEIGYMTNAPFHINKDFKDQVEKYVNNTFGNVTEPFIQNVTTKNDTRNLSLLMFMRRYTQIQKKLSEC